jgi:hypothetical protein
LQRLDQRCIRKTVIPSTLGADESGGSSDWLLVAAAGGRETRFINVYGSQMAQRNYERE